MKRIMMTLAAGLFAFGGVSAQNQDGAAQQAQGFDIEQVQPIGTVETTIEDGQETEQPDTGTVVLTQTTPDQQHANFDVVGPDGFHDHFDFEDADEGEHVHDGLQPGIYSIAASDEGLELAHTVIEVSAGGTTSVHVDLAVWDEAARVDPAATYGQVGMRPIEPVEDQQLDDVQEDDVQEVRGPVVQPGYPYGAWGVGPTRAIDAAEIGAIEVLGPDDQDFQVVITGPNGYSETAGNGDVVSDLFAGQYVLAATGNGLDLAVTTVEVQAGQQLQVEPNFGGAAARPQNGQQQDGETQN